MTLREMAPEKSDALCVALGEVFSEMVERNVPADKAWWSLFMFLSECFHKITIIQSDKNGDDDHAEITDRSSR